MDNNESLQLLEPQLLNLRSLGPCFIRTVLMFVRNKVGMKNLLRALGLQSSEDNQTKYSMGSSVGSINGDGESTYDRFVAPKYSHNARIDRYDIEI